MQLNSESIFESHIRDLIIRSKKTGRPVFSEFLNDKEKLIADKVANGMSCNRLFYGGYPDADNVIFAAFSGSEPAEEDFPITCLKINVTNKNADLRHSDYMGSVMALGIERDVFGDIVAYPKEAYIYVSDAMVDYFKDNLTNVGREKCFLTQEKGFIPNIEDKFSEHQIIIASDRLDCFIAAICRLSREKSSEAVKKRLIFVNGSEVLDPSKKLAEGDKIVIRGYGKYIIGKTDGKTHKDRLRIKVKKYN